MCNIINILLLLILMVVIYYLLFYLRKKENFQSMRMNNPILEINPNTGHINNRYILNTNVNYLEQILNNFNISNYDVQANNQNKFLSVYQHSGITINNVRYKPMGQCVLIGNKEMSTSQIEIQNMINNNESLHLLTSSKIKPLKYELIWNSGRLNTYSGDIFSIWRPIPPEGYVCMGDIIIKGVSPPSVDLIACIPKEDTNLININNGVMWNYNGNMINSKNITKEQITQMKELLIKGRINEYDSNNNGKTTDADEEIKKNMIQNILNMDKQQTIQYINGLNENESSENDIQCYSVSSHNYFRCKNGNNEEFNMYDIDRKNIAKHNTSNYNEEVITISLGSN
jgi:hypothetical protein